MAVKNFPVGTKIAKQPSKGEPRNKDQVTPTKYAKSMYDNPAVGKDSGKGTLPVKGKLG